MSRSILAHLSFNFYHSCQADYYVTFCITHQRDFGPNLPRVSPRNFVRVRNKNKIDNIEYTNYNAMYYNHLAQVFGIELTLNLI